MQQPFLTLVNRLALPGSLVALSLVTTSCKLPTRESWSQVQQRGLLPVLFASNPNTAASEDGKSPAAAASSTAVASTNGVNPEPAPPADLDAPVKVQAVKSAEVAKIPFATPVPDRAGFVYSPHTDRRKLIDVRAYAAGSEVRCPYTLQPFMVPDFNALAAAAAPAPKPQPQKSVAEVASRNDSRVNADRNAGALKETIPSPSHNAPVREPDLPDIPYGSRVAGRPGFVYSPFAEKNQLVDVAGIAPGVEVKCPYSGKLFRVPEPLPEELAPPPSNVIPQAPPPPSPAPAPAPTPSPAASTPAAAASLPTAAWAEKEKNLVQSPYGSPGQLVDVSGRAPGSTMPCPFTNKEFIIPAP